MDRIQSSCTNNRKLCDIGNYDLGILSNIYTNLLVAADEAGIIDINKFSSKKVYFSNGNFPQKNDGSVETANSVHSSGKMYIQGFAQSATRDEFRNKGIRNGTPSLWFLGDSGNAINILGVHEPLHGQNLF